MVGPLAADDLDSTPGWSCSRRFGLRQGSKIRPIDDHSISLVNDTFKAQETIDPSDIDVIAANARLHADALVSDVAARGASSPFGDLCRHPDLRGQRLVGRVWDIASAYKQLVV